MSDVAAETAVLATAFQSCEGFHDVADLVEARHFSEKTNGMWWKVIKEYYDKNPEGKLDIPTAQSLAHGLGLAPYLDKDSEYDFIYTIANAYIENFNGRRAAAKLAKLAIAKDVSQIMRDSANKIEKSTGEEPLFEMLNLAEKPLQDYIGNIGCDGEPDAFGVGLEEYLVSQAQNPCDYVGLSTNYPRFDEAIGGGLRRGTVTMFIARPGDGKSSHALNIGSHISDVLGFPALLLDTEMMKIQQWPRLMALHSGIPIKLFETGRFTEGTNREKAAEAMRKIQQIPFDYRNISGQPFEETVALIRRWVKTKVGKDENGKTKDCLVIFDYVKLMDEKGLSLLPEYQALGFLLTGLQNLAIELDIPILTFGQMNRAGIDDETGAVVAGSDRILWLVSAMAIWKEKSPDEMSNTHGYGNMKMVLLKKRYGPGLRGASYINFDFNRDIGKIRELGASADESSGFGEEPITTPEFSVDM